MNEKPTFASVTTEPCTCQYLQHAAEDAIKPIVFNEKTNEFLFKFGPESSGELVIYHCPFCGGAAPQSKRELLFARIPSEEQTRLASMLIPLKSIDEAIQALGTPEFDGYTVANYPDDEGNLKSIVYHRELRYYKLSDIADVCIHERSDGKINWQLDGKDLSS